MDGGYRAGRPVERRTASRPEPAYRQPEPPQPVNEPPKPVHRAPVQHRVEKEKKGWLKRLLWPLVVLAVVLLGIAGWLMWSNMNSSGAPGIDSSKYQAVFFENGQIYFGKLQPLDADHMKLTDIFYLQSQQSGKDSTNPQASSSDQSANSNMQLIKLGEEIHGPEDEMIVNKDQVLYYENLKDSGKVAQSIKKFKGSN
jgi:hypothetical protein